MAEAALAAREALAGYLLEQHPGDAAAALEGAPAGEAAEVLAARPEPAAARALELMVPARAARVLLELSEDRQRALLALVDAPRAASLLSWLDAADRERLLSALEPGSARELRELLSYPPNTAGSLMDPRVLTARETDTAGRALERLRDAPRARHQIHIVDEQHRLVGVVAVQDLALAAADARLAGLVEGPPRSINDMASGEEVVELLDRTGLASLAVTDMDGRLVGVLRHRALVDAAEGEALADLQQMVGAGRDERALSPISFAVMKRLPWLQINLVTAFVAASVVGIFESTIAQVTSLAVLLPVVAGQSGNSGAQALAVTMRGLALREVRLAQWRRLAAKELVVGALNGIMVALVCGAGVFVWSRSLGLAGVIAMAMVIAMAAAGLAGASIPLLLRAFGQDPAQSSSILLTTVTDVVGFLSFLGLATVFLRYL